METKLEGIKHLEDLVIQAKSKARRRAEAKAKKLLMIQHYTEYKKNFAKFYIEEIERIQEGSNEK